MSRSLEDHLAVFRSLETNEDALVILNDYDACRVLVAWTKTDQTWTRPRTAPPEPKHGQLAARWAWIVSGWDIDVEKVSRLAGLPQTVVHEKMEMLVGNRLVYPDGSTSGPAHKMLGTNTGLKLGFKPRHEQQGARRGKAQDDEDSN